MQNTQKQKEKIEKIYPDRIIQINDEIHLEILDLPHKSSLFQTVTKNRDFINDACDWANNFHSEDDSESFIQYFKQREQKMRQYCYSIIKENSVIGCVSIILRKDIGEIGYWLDRDMNGRGIVTQCANTLIKQGFTKFKLKELILTCQQKNKKSSNVALRLGFQFNKTRENTLNINGKDWVIDEYVLTQDQYLKQIEQSEIQQFIQNIDKLTLNKTS